nr:STAS domain-containing protein [Streptomyces sp. FXJ1.172]WEP00479.1 STAS domain-containing protein [Streptomyces sp. FXJ1.172]
MVVAHGAYDANSITPLADALETAASKYSRVVVDAWGLTLVDSTFLNLLLHIHHATELRAARPAPHIRRLMGVTGADAVLGVRATVEGDEAPAVSSRGMTTCCGGGRSSRSGQRRGAVGLSGFQVYGHGTRGLGVYAGERRSMGPARRGLSGSANVPGRLPPGRRRTPCSQTWRATSRSLMLLACE